MKVKELIEILKNCDGESNVRLLIERGRGVSGCEEFEISVGEDGISLNGEEDYYD